MKQSSGASDGSTAVVIFLQDDHYPPDLFSTISPEDNGSGKQKSCDIFLVVHVLEITYAHVQD